MKKILIIEDNEDNLYLIEFILKKYDLDIISAKNGYDGLKMAMNEDPDLILMDIQLPDINGLEVTKLIRNIEKCKSIPILAITSYAMTGDRQKSLDAGCTGYIEKPLNPETFADSVLKYL